MKPFAVIALFCDSVRDEASGAVTIVGIMPDAITLDKLPGAISRLVVYARVNFDIKSVAPSIEWFLRFPDGRQEARSPVPAEIIRESIKDVKSGMATIVTEIGAAPFKVQSAGVLEAVALIDGQEYVAGALYIGLHEADISDT